MQHQHGCLIKLHNNISFVVAPSAQYELGNSLLDAFYIGDKLIILLDYKSDQFHFNCRVLKNFFSKLYDPF